MMDCYVKYLGNISMVHHFEECNYAVNLEPIFLDKHNLGLDSHIWLPHVKCMLRNVPRFPGAENHFVTIASHFFNEEGGHLRREGVHIDGNFCADRSFKYRGWADIYFDECGKIVVPFKVADGVKVEEGTYVSSKLGGIICASSYTGCRAWYGNISDDVRDQGQYDKDNLNDATEVIFEGNKIYFMTSNTPHETLYTPPGIRRTLIRITLDHKYDNSLILEGKNNGSPYAEDVSYHDKIEVENERMD